MTEDQVAQAVAEPEWELADVTVTAGDRTFVLGKPGTPEFEANRLEFIRYQVAREDENTGLREPTHTVADYEEASAKFEHWNIGTLRAKREYELNPTQENLDKLNAHRGHMADAKQAMEEAYHGHHGTTMRGSELI